MGGVHSGSHSLGDALWAHERQRQRCHREGVAGSSRYGKRGSESLETAEQKKLLKRTRSLALIAEDNVRKEQECRYLRLGEPFDVPRKAQLIPRAKLIDRNSLKDRLSRSQQHLSESYNYDRLRESLKTDRNPVSCFREENRYRDRDRLNILDWPDHLRRYHSVQVLDGVGGLVDIVEDDWPLEENRSLDCIYTQVKRRRKEHRSLDSILLEDDSELEYFDVLDLLPLSKFRLEYDEIATGAASRSIDGSSNAITSTNRRSNDTNKRNNSTTKVSEDTDEKTDEPVEHAIRRTPATEEYRIRGHCGELEKHEDGNLNRKSLETVTESGRRSRINRCELRSEIQGESLKGKTDQSRRGVPIEDCSPAGSIAVLLTCCPEEGSAAACVGRTKSLRKKSENIEIAEDFKSIWISDSEEPDGDMSRRPQVLKIIDNDVTKRKHHSVDAIGTTEAHETAGSHQLKRQDLPEEPANCDCLKNQEQQEEEEEEEKEEEKEKLKKKKSEEKKETKVLYRGEKTKQNDGKLGRIIKETSNMFGKACSAVKGSLGFEARSESSDLGLGSEIGSETRRQSMDDGVETETVNDKFSKQSKLNNANGKANDRTNLTRSWSCVDSIECQDGAEFNHIRYKIIKSDMFSKNMFGSMNRDVAFDGLMQYLKQYSFQELLVDNKVVIIEPVRAERVEEKILGGKPGKSTKPIVGERTYKRSSKSENSSDSTTSVTNNNVTKSDGFDEEEKKMQSGNQQSSLKRHFFYHPIRINRELIDEELPDPDTVRNVRKIFEKSLTIKAPEDECPREGLYENNIPPGDKSVSMHDLRKVAEDRKHLADEPGASAGRQSRKANRAKKLKKLFEHMERTSSRSAARSTIGKEEDATERMRTDSKTRIIAQAFEARSGNSSPSEPTTLLSKGRLGRGPQSWDTGSVSSGVSSDYQDTDPGSGLRGASSGSSSEGEIDVDVDQEDENEEDLYYQDDDIFESTSGHFVSQDVLKKIRECGTSITYYGGKVVDISSGASLISPFGTKISTKLDIKEKCNGRDCADLMKFRLIKSNSCDSRLELTGRLGVEGSKTENKGHSQNRDSDLGTCPSVKISGTVGSDAKSSTTMQTLTPTLMEIPGRREPPIVIGLEPKREERRTRNPENPEKPKMMEGSSDELERKERGSEMQQRTEFILDEFDDPASRRSEGPFCANRLKETGLTRWQHNGQVSSRSSDFGNMDFEEFEVLDDSLNAEVVHQGPEPLLSQDKPTN